MNRKILTENVPAAGPLSLGSVYRRLDLHARFGGSRCAGIVPSKSEPAVLLFHTEEPSQQFYQDGFDSEGVYWYSGEGTQGDMSWTAANRALRDHAENGRDLLFLQRVQRTDGLWRFSFVFRYFCHNEESRLDKAGVLRRAIVFGLLPLAPDHLACGPRGEATLAELRQTAAGEPVSGDVQSRVRDVYRRSVAVREYALARAGGVCEACGSAAPFVALSGAPYLEVHYIDRLCDSGPEKLDRISAVCPNCHRRCHYSRDHQDLSSQLRARIAAIEREWSAADR